MFPAQKKPFPFSQSSPSSLLEVQARSFLFSSRLAVVIGYTILTAARILQGERNMRLAGSWSFVAEEKLESSAMSPATTLISYTGTCFALQAISSGLNHNIIVSKKFKAWKSELRGVLRS